MTVISLTSIPPRFSGLGPVLRSLRAQDTHIDEIRLVLPDRYRRFPNWDGRVPELPKGVRLVRTARDDGPACKVLPTVQAFKGTRRPILFCDDDKIYPASWARGLLAAHHASPDRCVATLGRHLGQGLPGSSPKDGRPRARLGSTRFDPAYRAARLRQQWAERSISARGPKPPARLVRRAGYADLLFGYAGALCLPSFFDDAVFDIPQDIWMVDDVWLSGHLARKGIGIWLPARLPVCQRASNDPVAALRDSLFDGADRVASDRRAIAYFQRLYGVWQ